MKIGEPEAEHINRINFVYTIVQAVVLAIAAIHFMLVAICIAGNTKFKFKIIFSWSALLEVIYHHPCIVHTPLRISLVSFYKILN